MQGVDYAWGHPGGAALQTAGVGFACRYLSHDTSKAISRAEADDLAAHGIWSAVVFEDAAQRPLAGHDAGVADAQLAQAQASAAGMPDDRPIYFAVDFDVTPAQQTAVNEYLAGAGTVIGGARVGVYGGYYTVQRALDAGVAAWAWQTVGWSGGQWEPRAQLRQPGGTVTIGGVDCDTNTATVDDYGQWMPGTTPHPVQEDDLSTTLPQDRSDSWNSMIWGLKHTTEATLALLQAQGATIAQLAQAVAAQHGLDPDALVAQIKTAIAEAVIKVDVSVNTPTTQS